MIVIVHGYDGSGPSHWQHWLRQELERRELPVLFPDLPDPTAPVCAAWVDTLVALVESSSTPVTFAAHSLGCWAVDHLLQRIGVSRIQGALLVAPPSPFSLFEPIQSFLPPPRSPQSWQPLRATSLLVGSDNDDYADADEITELASRLGIEHRILPGAGHINAAAGFGPFPLALDWVLAQQAR